MRVVHEDKLQAAGLEPRERFFVELWYGMTHLQSLDSYRVRCLNAHGVIRELNEELQIGRLNDSELESLCSEATEILQNDPVMAKHFNAEKRALLPLLAKPPKGKKGSKDEQELRYVTQDILVTLGPKYLGQLCSVIPEVVKCGDEEEVVWTVAALLSELVAQNWPLESLFTWHHHFLKSGDRREYTFEKDLCFMLRQFQRGSQPFRVTLRLSGSKKLAELETFHDFRFTETVTITKTEKEQIKGGPPDKFLRPYEDVVFATTTPHALDEASAAIQTRTAVEELLDLLRFDYESRVVKVDRRCLVRREGDARLMLHEIKHAVPNPRLVCELDDFEGLVKQVDTVATRTINDVSRQQLQTGIRQYRYGRDAEGYRDKFLAWWMGLEALTSPGQGSSIGARVASNASRAMLCDYLHRLLRDLLGTLKYLKIPLHADLQGLVNRSSINYLDVSQLLQVLQSSHASKLWDQLAAHPLLTFLGKQLQDALSEPKKTDFKLEEHRRHLEWHLDRLYRIRCCVVHGSPVRVNLALYAANLEFYLKEIIRFVLMAFNKNDHIVSLEELFHRADSRYKRVKTMLNDENAKSDAVREAVFMDVVVRQAPV